MSMETKSNQYIKINGSGTAGGGHYEEVKISGSGKITGDMECKEFRIDGSGKVEGSVIAKEIQINGTGTIKNNVKAGVVEINGTGTIEGNTDVGKLEVNGSSSFKKDVQIKEFEINGSSKVQGRITGGYVEVNGMLKVQNSCEVERVESNGSIQVKDLLSADSIELKIGYHSSAKEIGGEKIIVRQNTMNKFLRHVIGFFTNRLEILEVEVIEGDEVDLEVTKAKLVRGKNIIIGEKCEIDRVEYTDTLEVHPQAIVKESVKL